MRDGGVAPHLRAAVWPLLLGLLAPEDSDDAKAAKWAAAGAEYAHLIQLAGDDSAAALYYEQQVSRGELVGAQAAVGGKGKGVAGRCCFDRGMILR